MLAQAVNRARAVVDEIVANNKLRLCHHNRCRQAQRLRIVGDQIRELQINLVRSHA